MRVAAPEVARMSDPQQQFLLIPSAKARGFTRGANAIRWRPARCALRSPSA